MSARSSKRSYADMEDDYPVFNAYRTKTNGETSVVIQAIGQCMIDKDGVLTREAKNSIQSSVGEQVVRSMTNGKSIHFHIKMNGALEKHHCLTSVCPEEKGNIVGNEINLEEEKTLEKENNLVKMKSLEKSLKKSPKKDKKCEIPKN